MPIRLEEIQIRLKKIEDVKELFINLEAEMEITGSTEFHPDHNYHIHIQDAAQEMNDLVGYLLQVL